MQYTQVTVMRLPWAQHHNPGDSKAVTVSEKVIVPSGRHKTLEIQKEESHFKIFHIYVKIDEKNNNHHVGARN